MSREYGVVQCECGACEFDHALMQWTHESEGFARLSEPPVTTWRTVTGCSECMNRLGTSNDGRPWREAMVPRAALEWLAGKRGWMGCPGEWDCEAWCDERCGSSDEEVAACWVRSALKAAKEANASE